MTTVPAYPELKGKVAIVTGAGGTIGRVVALAFAASGSRVFVADTNEQAAAETCKLAREAGGDATPVKTDVTSSDDVAAMFARVLREAGRIDILVNNAAVGQGGRFPLTDVSEDAFDRVMRVNVKSVWLTMKHVMPHMIANGGGCIVNMSSVLGLMGSAGSSIYSTSKHAVLGLTKTAALEFGSKGVRINAVCPSRMESGMTGTWESPQALKDREAGIERMNPASRRAGRNAEVAAGVLFLCSDGAANIHGTALALDGGLVAGVRLADV